MIGDLFAGRFMPGMRVLISGYEQEPFGAMVLGATSPAGWHYVVKRDDGRIIRGVHVSSIKEVGR